MACFVRHLESLRRCKFFGGQMWPSRSRHCDENQNMHSSNHTRCLAQLRNLISLWCFRWTPRQNYANKQWLTLGEWGCPSILVQSWPQWPKSRYKKIEKIHPQQGAGEILQQNWNMFLPWVPYWCASITLDTFLVIWTLRC